MFRLLILVLVVAGAVWLWQQPKLPWQPAAPVKSEREAIREVSAAVLQPLESKHCLSEGEARESLQKIKGNLEISPTNPEDRRMMQAVVLLQAALNERSELLKRAMAGSEPTALDRVPGEWHIAGRPEVKVDREKLSRQGRSNFFALNALRKWRERSEYYRVSIERLLQPQ